MPELTLIRRQAELASAAAQLRILEQGTQWPRFHEAVASQGLEPLRAQGIEVLQVNLGKVCNQTCRHCHVDAGPDRREAMDLRTVDACIDALATGGMPVLDITGGAPEMNPHFRHLATAGRRLGRRVIDRSNLTILTAPGYADLPEFLAEQRVEIIASLPCYLEDNCDFQRGDGVFRRSIEALRRLNALGYGQPGSALSLTLVYNPTGSALPPSQAELEHQYRAALRERYGVEFTQLFTIANLPISRFLDDLLARGEFARYMSLLVDSFNPHTAGNVMCRTMLSVDWQGRLFDCDFNQMLELPLTGDVPRTIFEFSQGRLAQRSIATGRHCFGCTAGHGSSCQGVLA